MSELKTNYNHLVVNTNNCIEFKNPLLHKDFIRWGNTWGLEIGFEKDKITFDSDVGKADITKG